ncbi:hypothetical protein P167DRAFT_541518 [Morchella conica CCBAS932]|uniref:Secreted protein n=1 Tax=Morchella conica CCBAS932 TaxID=1392247 RepID=A0A3N4L1P8_9PEZI|nr:hypothetical protein P167DRAFT_541518 [Morchella conica CCBAS932]
MYVCLTLLAFVKGATIAIPCKYAQSPQCSMVCVNSGLIPSTNVRKIRDDQYHGSSGAEATCRTYTSKKSLKEMYPGYRVSSVCCCSSWQPWDQGEMKCAPKYSAF